MLLGTGVCGNSRKEEKGEGGSIDGVMSDADF